MESTQTYLILQVPANLYTSWKEIAWSMTDKRVAQGVLLHLLQAWVWQKYSDYRLCAFEETGGHETVNESCLYVKLRKLTPSELSLSADVKAGRSLEPDPQWTLEFPQIDELQTPLLTNISPEITQIPEIPLS